MSLSVICRTFPSQLTLTATSRGGEEKNKTCRKRESTADTSPSRLGRRLPLAEAKTASHGVGGPAAVSVLDFDGHAEQFRKAFVGQSIFQRTGIDDGASTGIAH